MHNQNIGVGSSIRLGGGGGAQELVVKKRK